MTFAVLTIFGKKMIGNPFRIPLSCQKVNSLYGMLVSILLPLRKIFFNTIIASQLNVFDVTTTWNLLSTSFSFAPLLLPLGELSILVMIPTLLAFLLSLNGGSRYKSFFILWSLPLASISLLGSVGKFGNQETRLFWRSRQNNLMQVWNNAFYGFIEFMGSSHNLVIFPFSTSTMNLTTHKNFLDDSTINIKITDGFKYLR